MVEYGSPARYTELETNYPGPLSTDTASHRRASALPGRQVALFSTHARRHLPQDAPLDSPSRPDRQSLSLYGIQRGVGTGFRFCPKLRKRAWQSNGAFLLIVFHAQSRKRDRSIRFRHWGTHGSQKIIETLPNENTVYLGDTARAPYGTKSVETVLRYSFENTEFLVQKGVKAVVVACNTSTAIALPPLRDSLSIPVIGVIEVGVRKAI